MGVGAKRIDPLNKTAVQALYTRGQNGRVARRGSHKHGLIATQHLSPRNRCKRIARHRSKYVNNNVNNNETVPYANRQLKNYLHSAKNSKYNTTFVVQTTNN